MSDRVLGREAVDRHHHWPGADRSRDRPPQVDRADRPLIWFGRVGGLIMWSMENVPRWAALTTWVVVNLVNLAQSVGFASRRSHAMVVNHLLGAVIAMLAVPATVALVGYARAGSPWWLGPAVFDLFVALMLVVDYLWPVEFRRPAKPAILVPYLLLFFGSILVMGISMFELNRGLWLVTVATSVTLLGTMVRALRQGTA